MHEHLTCTHPADILQDLLDNQLAGPEMREAETLILECASCRDYFFSLRELSTELRRTPVERAPKGFTVSTMDLIRKEERKKRPLQVLVGIAAAAVVFVGIGLSIGPAENSIDTDAFPQAAVVVELDGSSPLEAEGWAIGGVSLALIGSAFLLKRLVETDGVTA